MKQKPAIIIGNNEFTAAEYSYMYFLQFQEFLDSVKIYELNNGEGTSGYDMSKLPIDQALPDDKGEQSNYAMYVNQLAETYWSKIAIYYDMAIKAGYSLNEEEKKEREKKIEEYRSPAKTYGMDTDAYLEQFYTKGVTAELLGRLKEMELIAQRYSEERMAEIGENFEQSYIDDVYKKNAVTYDSADIRLYSIGTQVTKENDETEEEFKKNVEFMESESLKYAKEMCSVVRDAESFEQYLIDNKFCHESNVREETEHLALKKSDVSVGYLVDDEGKTKGILLSDWVFSKERRAGDKCIAALEDAGQKYYMVVLVTMPKYKEELADLRHIFFSTTQRDERGNLGNLTEEEIKKAKENSEKVFEAWQTGEDKSEEEFISLVKKYSEDSYDEEGEGLKLDVSKDSADFAISDWTFAADRKVGDVGLVKGEEGYHILMLTQKKYYYDLQIRSDKASEQFSKEVKEFQENCEFSTDTNLINSAITTSMKYIERTLTI